MAVMSSLQALEKKWMPRPETVTHINLAGIRYLPLAPATVLRRAVHEYLDTHPSAGNDILRYLAEHPSVILCREDWKRVICAAGGARADCNLSAESRNTFAHIHDVLNRAIPWRPARNGQLAD
ncbi:MAG TPA: hypothetical protein VHR86_10210 [Armatimonadota bacterium]|nr:hypothetical protein [Armatimonadota bacterium]